MKFQENENTTYLFQFFHKNNHQYPKRAEITKVGTWKKPPVRRSFTYCRVVEKTGLEKELFTTQSTCNPEDQFVKDTGRRVSLERALKELNKGKEFNARVWEQYNKETRKPKL